MSIKRHHLSSLIAALSLASAVSKKTGTKKEYVIRMREKDNNYPKMAPQFRDTSGDAWRRSGKCRGKKPR